MIYQGMEVTFSQPTTAQFNALMMELGRTNMQVRTNSDNLMKMGKDMTIMGKNDTWFGTEITKLKNLISTGGQGMNRQQVENIVENYHGDDIALLHSNSMSLGDSQKAAKKQRDSMEAKIKSNKDEHTDFHTKLTDLGISLKDHSHNGGGGIMQYLPLIAVGGLAVYLLKRKK